MIIYKRSSLPTYIPYFFIVIIVSLTVSLSQNVNQYNDSLLISNIKTHLNYLGSDELAGRATGSEGAHLAADYIAKCMDKYDVQPFGDNNSHFQNIPMYGSKPLTHSELLLQSGQDTIILKLSEDYLLYKSGAQTHIPNPVPLVFVGFGIIAPEYDYNDYLNVDINGKIAVFFSGEPEYDDPEYFRGDNPTVYSYPESKQRIAISQGAIGSILIPHPDDKKYESWKKLTREFSFEDVTMAYRVTGHLSLLLNPKHISKLFYSTSFKFKEILQQIMIHQSKSFPLNASVSFKGYFNEREFLGKNVAGLIEGSDPFLRDSYIIVSAHYDHLGIGSIIHQDSIYNGVVDNALGVSAVLEIARLLQETELSPRRSILFLFLTGEEKGLLGSQYYVDHPLIPLYKTIANVNIDGIAIFDKFNDIIGIGSDLSSLRDIIEAVARINGLHLSDVPPQFLDFESFARSDQMAFAQGGIPSVLISDGINYKSLSPAEGLNCWITWAEEIYHSPFDDLFQPLNYMAIEQHVLFLYDFCHRLSRMNQQPQWNPGTIYRNIRLRTIAEKR